MARRGKVAARVERMADLVREAIIAGALGFSTSRTIVHRSITGDPVPGTFAAEDELFALGRLPGRHGKPRMLWFSKG